MFFKRKKVSDYLQDEKFVQEIETLKKSHHDEIEHSESVQPQQPQVTEKKLESVAPIQPETLPVEKAESIEQKPAAVENTDEKIKLFESAVGELIQEELQEVRKIASAESELFESHSDLVEQAENILQPKAPEVVVEEVKPLIIETPVPMPKLEKLTFKPAFDPETPAKNSDEPMEIKAPTGIFNLKTTHSIEPEMPKEVAVSAASEPETKISFIGRLKASLTKTKDTFTRKISWIISSKTTIDEDVLEDLEEALYTSDIGVKTTEMIMKNIRKSVKEQRYQETSQLKKIIKEEISALIKSDDTLAKAEFATLPHVILVVGVNGNGKTTTIGKLAHYYKKMGKKVIVGAADTFRAAAIEQLEVWAERAGCEVVKQQMGADPAAVAYNAYEAAISRKADVLLIDTAGRLHTKVNLMNELEKISRVLKKFNPDAPHDVLLVLDATTGQNALSQARLFTESTGITGLVLTKLDGTAKGGVAIAINQELDIPVKFIGIGEKIDDLALFNIEDYVQAIFD